jgi:hypothetical protein
VTPGKPPCAVSYLCLVHVGCTTQRWGEGCRLHVTDFYGLDRTQAEVDFVDVDVSTDNRIFIDPRAIRLQQGELQEGCVACLVSFFTEILDAIRLNRPAKVRELMRHLGEPNETHLGFSRGRSRGRGLRGTKTDVIADAISASRAAQTGLLRDLEDTAFLVPGVDKDLLSDMTTQIIRGPLIEYTQQCCVQYEIPMEAQYGGSVWDPNSLEWEDHYDVSLPRTEDGALLLIPKSIVRHAPILDNDKYFNGYLAPYLEDEEVRAHSQLVSLLKNGTAKVNRTKLREKYGSTKDSVVDQTIRLDKKPLQRYRDVAGKITAPPMVNEDIADTVGSPQVNFLEAYGKVAAIRPGPEGATLYHRAVFDLLSAAFYPPLANFKKEDKIHDGRKRIDITCDNVASVGFFDWANRGYHCPIISIECKNYDHDPANPELDQLSGRFSDQRGSIGLLICRRFKDKALFLERCRDTSRDRRGFVIALDDNDLKTLAEEAAKLQYETRRDKRFAFPLLRERFDLLVK